MKEHLKVKAVSFYREAELHHAGILSLREDGVLLRIEAGILRKIAVGTVGE